MKNKVRLLLKSRFISSCIIFCVLAQPIAHAAELEMQDETPEVTQTEHLSMEDLDVAEDTTTAEKVKIADIKKLATDLGTANTCLDDYLALRKQLIIKLSLTPLTGSATLLGGFFGGGFTGKLLSSNSTDPWADLAYVVGGLLIGTTASASFVITDTTIKAIRLSNINLMMKAIAEQRLDRSGKKSDRLYQRYKNQTDSPLELDAFFKELLAKDESGALCDGTLFSLNRLQRKHVLKNKVARPKQFFKSL